MGTYVLETYRAVPPNIRGLNTFIVEKAVWLITPLHSYLHLHFEKMDYFFTFLIFYLLPPKAVLTLIKLFKKFELTYSATLEV